MTTDPIVIVGAARTPMGGFLGDLKDAPADAAAPPAFYPPLRQNPTFGIYVALRTGAQTATAIPAVRQLAQKMGNDLSVQDIRPVQDVIAEAADELVKEAMS